MNGSGLIVEAWIRCWSLVVVLYYVEKSAKDFDTISCSMMILPWPEMIPNHAINFVWVHWRTNNTSLGMNGSGLIVDAWIRCWSLQKLLNCYQKLLLLFYDSLVHYYDCNASKCFQILQSSLYGFIERQTTLHWEWMGLDSLWLWIKAVRRFAKFGKIVAAVSTQACRSPHNNAPINGRKQHLGKYFSWHIKQTNCSTCTNKSRVQRNIHYSAI